MAPIPPVGGILSGRDWTEMAVHGYVGTASVYTADQLLLFDFSDTQMFHILQRPGPLLYRVTTAQANTWLGTVTINKVFLNF